MSRVEQINDAQAAYQQRFMFPADVASMLGVTAETLLRWRSQGYGPPYRKRGRRVVYVREQVEEWDEAQTVYPGSSQPGQQSPSARKGEGPR
ncbi:MAG: helix-turn-helix domain-containing protein [Pseudomonadota bacterium]